MSTTPTETSPFAPIPLGSHAETAPSPMLADGSSFSRMVGFAGLVLVVLGAAAVISTKALGPRMVSEGLGFLFAAVGLAMMLYHATTDGEQEVRRLYGAFSLLWILISVVASFVPGPMGDGTAEKAWGYYLLPLGAGAGIIGLMFMVPFCRHETDESLRNRALTLLLAIGGLLSVGSLTAGVFRPEFLTGPGLTLALLGLAFLCVYFGQVDVSEGIGYTVAFSLGAVGALVTFYAIGRAAFPTLLFDGPAPLRLANGERDIWKTGFRLLGGVGFVIPAIVAFSTRSSLWLKGVTGLIGLIGGGVVLVSLATNPITTQPKPFLVPNGLILMAVGLLYLSVSLGVCSDNQFVTMTRRELSSYFLSPIGYLVLGAMAAMQWWFYETFTGRLAHEAMSERAFPEPILAGYINVLSLIALLQMVPALTMRLVAEERRTGSLEVLLTAPVNEWPVVLSKFVSTWIFFMICWAPAALYLVALRLEVPVPFDYRPLISFYICLAVQATAFVGMGLFFSTLTRNEIVAAALTQMGMMFFLLCYLVRESQSAQWLPAAVRPALGRLSFFHMWQESLSGRLPLRDTFLFGSLGMFWLFLSVKVLETRKWN